MPPLPAGPPTFHFRARLLDADGKPFGEREYMIVWGKERVMGWTTPDGDVEAQLQGKIEKGVLHLGEGSTPDTFEAFISIPIVKVPEYPPPPEPIELTSPPRPPAGPPPEPPLPPNWESPEDVDRWNRERVPWEQYQDYLRRQRAWHSSIEREVERYEREYAEALTQLAGLGKSEPPLFPSLPGRLPDLADEELKRRIEAINRARRETYEMYKLQFDLFWRLRNLGYLLADFRGTGNFVMRGGDGSRLALEDACGRYAHKYQLTIPNTVDFTLRPPPAVLVDLLRHVKTVHDTHTWIDQKVGP